MTQVKRWKRSTISPASRWKVIYYDAGETLETTLTEDKTQKSTKHKTIKKQVKQQPKNCTKK